MIQVSDKAKCCGCTACASSCPKNCITMQYDEEGFLYPVVHKDLCVNCGICDQVCPFGHLNDRVSTNSSTYMAFQNSNQNVRMDSTAGGAFSLIAEYIINNGGIVYAVGYNAEMTVCHEKCDSIRGLNKLRGSKYVQSDLRNIFVDIKSNIVERLVLFVGTPCQVHGLKAFIGDNKNLYTIDLLCLGVSSPRLFAEWIDYLNDKYHSQVRHVSFRDKHYGYATPNVRVFFENGKSMDQKYDTRVHANLFFRHYNVRPSCYECQFREVPRVSDFTIGDFNEIGSINKKMDDDKGTTKVWIHTGHGKELFRALEASAVYYILDESSSNIIGGPKKQIKIPDKRENFFTDASKMSYSDLISKWQPRNLKGELAGVLRPLINMLPFKTKIFQYLRKKKMNNYEKNVRDLNSKKNE